ncbi:hypothetical protein KG088_17155 [Halomonas sp. TRM85114]|uniref:hypothetical protein n=1 Tax=Halomonas jincaotanensis TaxID=2810616 RepID=UPI001BD4C8F2|nr:hypothetical protein [Halomonas jincaotanensis]MBS9405343.1 hypothetical protein [Halomonas jincaotanensis]
MSYNTTFAETMERLLAGDVICEIAFRKGFDLICDPHQFRILNDTLMLMGRQLAQTEDGVGYYAVYQDLSDAGRRRRVQTRFEKAAGEWEGLCYWLRLTCKVSHDHYPIHAGDVLTLSSLLESIEDSVSSQQDVEKIARRLKAGGRRDTKSQLEGILQRLEDKGYLVPQGVSGASWKATSLWSLLMEQMAYVQRQEGIMIEEADEDETHAQEDQGALF